ncbi:MAG: hypothetical protein Q9185_002769 [Variospora sp. 1 TL-2023]
MAVANNSPSSPNPQSTTTTATILQTQQQQQQQQQKEQPTIYLPTTLAYNAWAPTYDTDSNFLLALDTHLFTTQLLPALLSSLAPSSPRIIDLGCGTGRSTLPLLRIPGARILGLDSSTRMLQKASARCTEVWQGLPRGERAAALGFDVWDMLCCGTKKKNPPPLPGCVVGEGKGGKEEKEEDEGVDAVISTLVVEHVPLDVFFDVVGKMVRKKGKGVVLVTNMHADMGRSSQAGFRVGGTGEKVRGKSYVHDMEEVVEVARREGWRVRWGPEEREIREEDVGRLGERARKWVGRKVWFGMLLERG